MTTSLFNKINAILAEWNPIGVPQGLALDEYKSYVPLLLSAYNRGQNIENFLLWVYEEQIGFNVNEEFWRYTSPIATYLTTLLKTAEEGPF